MTINLPMALLALAVLNGVIYALWSCKQPTSTFRSLSKTTAIAALSGFAYLAGGPWLLVAALGLSALGDLFLSRDGDAAFLAGMVAFLAAHLAYVPLFLGLNEGTALLAQRWPLVLGIAIYMLLFMRFLWPSLGQFRLPVAVYSLAIAGMGIAALNLPAQGGQGYVLLGAASFILSDSVLAVERFQLPETSRLNVITPYIVWIFYWLAQALITYGTLLSVA
ncbi:MAG: lysoplasmalogenase [Alphaproteobacteria bacterium]|nr:lysoplasmalogenase [Alphaproteobacteria bacterium]